MKTSKNNDIMKTTLKTLVAVLLLAVCPINIIAQDTIYGHLLPDKFFSPDWPDTSYTNNNPVFYHIPACGILSLKRADSSLTIYGIAAGLVSNLDILDSEDLASEAIYVYDTSRAALIDEKLYLMEIEGDSVYQLGEDLSVSVSAPPDYYWDLQLTRAVTYEPYPVIPMFEGYFDTPLEVWDSFALGHRATNGWGYDPGDERSGVELYNWPVHLAAFLLYDEDEDDFIRISGEQTLEWVEHTFTDENGDIHKWEGWERTRRAFYEGTILIFPILTPNPDTTRDGIGNVRAEERLVGVMPNPATGQVKVVSSFGMTHFDVYDAAGRRVLSRDVQGLQASFDVAAWPRGAYTVHVLTPAGTTVKKLLVE